VRSKVRKSCISLHPKGLGALSQTGQVYILERKAFRGNVTEKKGIKKEGVVKTLPGHAKLGKGKGAGRDECGGILFQLLIETGGRKGV